MASPQLDAQAATENKFQNAPAWFASQGINPGFALPVALLEMYDQASDQVADLDTHNSSVVGSFTAPLFAPGIGVVSGVGVVEASRGSKDDSLIDEVQGNDDIEYYGPLNFGSRAQTLTIDFDTGSADLWIPVNCGNCGNLKRFQASSSSTYQNTGKRFQVTYVRSITPLNYGKGDVSGTLAHDIVTVGSFGVPDQYFGAVNSVSQNFAEAPNDGLAGLAFSTISNSGKPTFFENLIAQGSVQVPLFSVYLTRGQLQGSEICFGCIETSKVTRDTKSRTVQWVPVISKTYWTVDMNGVSVNNQLVSTSGLHGVIDTGTSFIYVPQATANDIYNLCTERKLGFQHSAPEVGSGFYSYPCNSPVQISFVFGNKKFALDPRDLNLGRLSDGSCIGAIIGLSGSTFNGIAIIGDSFLKSYVSVYDYSHKMRVGFVKSINE
ncbi:hypothetical protein HYDPIDRAFT_173994 [Hydnomerulius pinastri MD-312]|nr:hypothetical protein HYDPIDRAFT_173994 [Hydnomerulius pinastri MD-312]